MNCLHCGDCCLRMCPINGGKCEYVKEIGTFYLCGIYDKRPKECVNHKYDTRFCPIGLSKLKLTDSDSIRARIDEGHRLIKAGSASIIKE